MPVDAQRDALEVLKKAKPKDLQPIFLKELVGISEVVETDEASAQALRTLIIEKGNMGLMISREFRRIVEIVLRGDLIEIGEKSVGECLVSE